METMGLEYYLGYIDIHLEFLLEFKLKLNLNLWIPKVFCEVISQDKWRKYSHYQKIITFYLFF